MEWQDELGLNLYDMDMRDYDPAVGRWLGIDPVTHFDQSPYMAFNGNPVTFADPTGADGVGGETYTSVFGMQVSTPNNTGMYTGYSVGASFGALNLNVGPGWGDRGLLPYNSIDRFERANIDSWNLDLDNLSRVNSGNKTKSKFDVNVGDLEGEFIANNEPGGTWDSWGVGSVPYDGTAIGGTNFIGPGPDANPYSLGLDPIDCVDALALKHDYAYYKANTGGVNGAVLNIKVKRADLALVMGAAAVLVNYAQHKIDPVTQLPISQRTSRLAAAIVAAFMPIVESKYSRSIILKL